MSKYFHRHARYLSTLIIIALFAACLWQLAMAGWIQGKAVVAQSLLNHAWKQTVNDAETDDEQIHKPWPWADTWPVARLTVPQYDIEQIVLAGDSGSSLAFGPGYSFASARPNSNGLTMISAHRDTHFKFLKDLKRDDLLYLQTPDSTVQYHVYDFQIVDSRTFSLPADTEENTLLLMTCYPFDAITPGGYLRYLVYAEKQLM
jgi:sortase A